MSTARNTLYNTLGGLFPMLVALVTVPLFIRFIGTSEYGILTIAWLLMGYSTYAELGLGQSIANEIARLGEGKVAERNIVFWTGFLMALFLGLVIGLGIMCVGYWAVPKWGTLAYPLRIELLHALPWLVAAGPLSAGNSVLASAIESRHHFKHTNIIQSVGWALSQGLPLVTIVVGHRTLSWLVGFAVLGRMVTFTALLLTLGKLLPLHWTVPFNRRKLGFLFGFGGWVTISNIAETVLSSLDRWLAGAFLGAQAVAYYAVPANLATRTAVFPVALVRTYFPKFSAMDPQAALHETLRATVYLGRGLAPIMGLGIIVIGPFLRLWVGPQFAENALAVAPVLLVAAWLRSIAFMPDVLLRATRRPRTVALTRLAEVPLLFGVSWLGFKWFGLPGLAWAWCFRVGVDAAWLWRRAGNAKYIARKLLLPAAGLLAIYLVMANKSLFPKLLPYGMSFAITVALVGWTVIVDWELWVRVCSQIWQGKSHKNLITR